MTDLEYFSQSVFNTIINIPIAWRQAFGVTSPKLKNNKDCPPIAIEDNTVPKNDNNVPATNSTSPKFLFFKTDFCLMYK